MNDSRRLSSRLGTSSRLVLVWLLLLCLALGGITFASYRSQDDTATSGRTAAFNVVVATGGVDIESGRQGAHSWKLDLETGDRSKTREFAVTNKSEVTVKCTPSLVRTDPKTDTPNVTFAPSAGFTLEPGESKTLTITAKPANLSQGMRSRTDKGAVTFSIVQVD